MLAGRSVDGSVLKSSLSTTGELRDAARRCLLSMAAVTGLLTVSLSAQADTPTREASLQDLARRMIDSCLKYAAKKGLPPLAVAVVDASGALIRFERQDGAPPLVADAAVLKAQTAIRAHAPTAELARGVAQDATVRDFYDLLHLTALPGGMPVFRGDASLRAAVGVSGAEASQDAKCAQQAAAAGHAVTSGLSRSEDR